MGYQLPTYVARMLRQLEEAGYQAVIVGGAVRDLLLGRPPSDYDIATNARPEEIEAVAQTAGWKVISGLGRNFGVLMVVIQGKVLEVAVFRGERYGADSHRPEKVWYTDKLGEDLARRDFTMNAIAMTREGQVIDPFGGRQDLDRQLIRTVGKANDRFQEDALRMFRACRFAAQLGFTVEQTAVTAIPNQLERVAGLSLERIKEELDKTLLGDYCRQGLEIMADSRLLFTCCRIKDHGRYQAVDILPELEHLVGLPQNSHYHCYDGWQHTLRTVENTPPELLLRWAALLHDIGKGMPEVRGIHDNGQPSDHGHDQLSAVMAQTIAERLQIPLKWRSWLLWLISHHMKFHYLRDSGDDAVLRWLRAEARSGQFRSQDGLAKGFSQLEALCIADIKATGRPYVAAAEAAFGQRIQNLIFRMPVRTSEIACSATGLLPVLGCTKHMGAFLRWALQSVQDGSLANEEPELLRAAEKWIVRKEQSGILS
ncbi:MAG: HD domain-containing protein [Veillonellales bacterium]